MDESAYTRYMEQDVLATRVVLQELGDIVHLKSNETQGKGERFRPTSKTRNQPRSPEAKNRRTGYCPVPDQPCHGWRPSSPSWMRVARHLTVRIAASSGSPPPWIDHALFNRSSCWGERWGISMGRRWRRWTEIERGNLGGSGVEQSWAHQERLLLVLVRSWSSVGGCSDTMSPRRRWREGKIIELIGFPDR